MAISFVDSVGATSSSSPPAANFTLPEDLQLNDLLIAFVGTNGAGADITPPSGWTELEYVKGEGSGQPGGTQTSGVWYRYAVPADSESAVSFGVVGGAGTKQAGVIVIYRSDHPVNVVIFGDHASRPETSAGLTHDNPTLEGVAEDTLLISGIHKKGSAVTDIDPPDGWIEILDNYAPLNNNDAVSVATLITATTGDVTGTWTTDVSTLHAATFSMVLTEGLPPSAGLIVKPVLRRWNGFSWTLIG
jgi:hypothetical protein